MTKNDYALVAASMKEALDDLRFGRNDYGQGNYGFDGIRKVAEGFARRAAAANPQFDRGLFFEAVGLKP